MNIIGDAIKDKRINSSNYMLELTLKEYYDLSKDILKNNEYQRRRVKSSSTVYSLLREDLKRGCLMPPIVLALATDDDISKDVLITYMQENKNRLVILDGLQRSYTIKGLIEDILKDDDIDSSTVFNNKIRAEIYVGINKLGVLYRMLTLNTGQTPMTTRHQIEIIYSDYIETGIKGVRLLRENDDQSPKNLGEYRFNDIIEGFTSFIQRDYLTLERSDILESIKSLEKVSMNDNSSKLFEQFVQAYHCFVNKLHEICPQDIPIDRERLSSVFGTDVVSMFKKSQPMTGFGAAIGRLVDLGDLKSIEDVNDYVEKLKVSTVQDGLSLLLRDLSYVRDVAKKIGNDQRLYFRNFFRSLFDRELDSFCDISAAAMAARRSYERETL